MSVKVRPLRTLRGLYPDESVDSSSLTLTYEYGKVSKWGFSQHWKVQFRLDLSKLGSNLHRANETVVSSNLRGSIHSESVRSDHNKSVDLSNPRRANESIDSSYLREGIRSESVGSDPEEEMTEEEEQKPPKKKKKTKKKRK